MKEALAPLQFGVGVSDGATVVYRGVEALLAANPEWGVLSLDIQNAFNTVDRSAMFQALRDRGFGDWIPFIRLFYGSPSDLLYTGVPQPSTLSSERGCRQGDPLGPSSLRSRSKTC